MTFSLQFKPILKSIAFAGAAAGLSLSLAGCSSDDDNNSDTGANTTAPVSATAAYDAAQPFPSGSCLLWKPVSEIDHGLVVLVPAAGFSGRVVIRRPNGEVFATAREHVDARGHNQCNGIRYHYVFGKGPGSSYPQKSILSIGSANYKIPNPAGRYE